MNCVAPSEKDADNAALERRLWGAAEQAVPAPHFAKADFNGGRPQGLLGLIFLRSDEVRFAAQRANPPSNVNAVDTAMRVSARCHSEGTPQDLPERQDHERLRDMVGPGRRFPFGLPRTDNANFLWIQLFDSALNEKGRAGFVMASSASDACSSEQEIRRQLIETQWSRN